MKNTRAINSSRKKRHRKKNQRKTFTYPGISTGPSSSSNFLANIEAIEVHLITSEKHALDLSQRVAAERREVECLSLLRQAEQRVESLFRDQLHTKRKLASLYTSLVTTASASTSNALTKKSETSLPVADNSQVLPHRTVDPFLPLCPYALMGTCNDNSCPFQHLSGSTGPRGGRHRVDESARTDDHKLFKRKFSAYFKAYSARKLKSLANDDGAVPDNDTVMRCPVARYFTVSGTDSQNWRANLVQALAGMTPSSGPRSRAISSHPLVTALQTLLRSPLTSHERWIGIALNTLSAALDDVSNRSDSSLWLVYLSVLGHASASDRPSVDIFIPFLRKTFPTSWEIYIALTNLISSTPTTLHAWLSSCMGTGAGSQAVGVVGSNDEGDVATTSGSLSRLSVPPYWDLIALHYLEGLCVRGRHSDVIDLLSQLLAGEPYFAEESVYVASSLSSSVAILPRDVLWATLLLLLLTGDFGGMRILCLQKAGLPYISHQSWHETVRRGTALMTRSATFRDRLLALTNRALAEVSEPGPGSVVSGDVGRAGAASQALCWSCICINAMLPRTDTSLRGQAETCLVHCMPKIQPFLFPLDVVAGYSSCTFLDNDKDSLMTINCMLYLDDFSESSQANFAASLLTYVHSHAEGNTGVGIPASEELDDDDKAELEHWFWNVNKVITSSNVTRVLMRWIYVGLTLALFTRTNVDRISAVCMRVVSLRLVVHLQPLLLFVLASASLIARDLVTRRQLPSSLSSSLQVSANPPVTSILNFVFLCIEASLIRPEASDGLHIPNTCASDSPSSYLYLDLYDSVLYLPQHAMLLRILRTLHAVKLLQWSDVELVVKSSVTLLPRPEVIVTCFLDMQMEHQHRDFLISLALSEYVPAHAYINMSAQTCWRVVHLMCSTEKFETVRLLRDQLRLSRRAQDRFYASCVDVYLGLDAPDASATPTSSTEQSMDLDFEGLYLPRCQLEDSVDLSRLDDRTLRRLETVCEADDDSTKSSGVTVADFNGSFPRGFEDVPVSLCLAKRLQELSLENNNFVVLPPPVLCLSQLLRLNLSWNSLTFLPTTLHSSLPLLRVVNLSHNQFITFPMTLVRLPALTELSLSNNRLQYLPKQIEKLQNLRVLDVSDNALKVVPSGLAQKMKLQFLKLSGNPASTMAR